MKHYRMRRWKGCLLYTSITIYRHVSPDSDALGSQFGLKQWIQDTYPKKQVYALGSSGSGSRDGNFPAMDVVDDETITQSLAIILDTANSARVDDERFLNAAYRLKIDHHIYVETFADVEIIQDLKGATCEILADMFMQKGIRISALCAQYLYGGLIADTLDVYKRQQKKHKKCGNGDTVSIYWI